MSEIKFNPIPEKSAGDRPSRPDERKPVSEPMQEEIDKDKYYSPEDVVEISEDARRLANEEIDPK